LCGAQAKHDALFRNLRAAAASFCQWAVALGLTS
jgi:hypothetical protein